VTQLDVDLIVLGFGKGGKTLAADMGKRGWRVALVEQSAAMYGGTCINTGCVPTKSMVYQGERLSGERITPQAYTAAVDTTAHLTARLRAVNLATFDPIATATVFTGRARFVDANTVEVTTADDVISISARFIVVSTGSEPVIPPIPGLADCPVAVTSTQLLSQRDLPLRLVVLGGGYIGLEFAAMFASYGSHVTVLDRGSRILRREDDDVAFNVLEILSDKGIHITAGAEIIEVRTDQGAGATVRYRADGTEHQAPADTVLVAMGRRPVTADLNLQAAGVQTAADGSIVVDEYLRTNQSHVFAIGDVNGGPQFTYISLDDYRVVLDQLTGAANPRSTTRRVAVPNTLFITPPLARVGLTERQARNAGMRIKVASSPVAKLATVSRARIVSETEGMMKVVVDADTDLILGATLLSYDSHEVINTVALAMRHGITATDLRDEIYTHPSMTECFNQLLGLLAAAN
jgi:pyruvate/2-oxoglutarate dehydrogenase complex dihydrolipoamide dehydrogenase (E3) component